MKTLNFDFCIPIALVKICFPIYTVAINHAKVPLYQMVISFTKPYFVDYSVIWSHGLVYLQSSILPVAHCLRPTRSSSSNNAKYVLRNLKLPITTNHA